MIFDGLCDWNAGERGLDGDMGDPGNDGTEYHHVYQGQLGFDWNVIPIIKFIKTHSVVEHEVNSNWSRTYSIALHCWILYWKSQLQRWGNSTWIDQGFIGNKFNQVKWI